MNQIKFAMAVSFLQWKCFVHKLLFFLKRHQESQKKHDDIFSFGVHWNSQWLQLIISQFEKVLFGKKLDTYWHITWNDAEFTKKQVYVAINQVSWTEILRVLCISCVNRLISVVTCVIETMCLRPYPVYIKMWAKVNKIRTFVICLCTQFFLLKRTEQLFLVVFVVTEIRKYGSIKGRINKRKNIKWHLRILKSHADGDSTGYQTEE